MKRKKWVSGNRRGSYTVEMALILPLILTVIAAFLLLTGKQYHQSQKKIGQLYDQAEPKRDPVRIINHTDLFLEYLERLGVRIKGESA